MPTVQTVHILAIAVVASSVLMIDLRLIGMFWADRPLKDVSSRFLPPVWWSLPVLLVTGAIMIISEPARSLKNPAFQLKMTLLIAALVVTGLFQILARRNASFGERPRAFGGAGPEPDNPDRAAHHRQDRAGQELPGRQVQHLRGRPRRALQKG